MPTVLAPRGVFGVIVPSTNTIVENEYYRARPPGVSLNAGRILIENENLDSDEVFLAGLCERLAREVELVVGCEVAAVEGLKCESATAMATLWHALRTNGITDRIAGRGRLFELF